jgi:hypothetical protein
MGADQKNASQMGIFFVFRMKQVFIHRCNNNADNEKIKTYFINPTAFH